MSTKKSIWNSETNLFCDDNYNYSRLYNHFSLIAKNRFRWHNLPPGIESRHIENGLFRSGAVGFVFDPEIGYLALPCTQINSINVYGDSKEYILTGHGFSKHYPDDKCVRILNNDNGTADIILVDYYAMLIDEVEQTSLINLKQQRTPYIVSSTKNNELSLKNMMKRIFKGDMAIYVDEKFSQGGNVGINALQTNAPYILDKLQQHKHDLMSELYSLLGLNNKNTEKKERLLVDEVNVNNSQILMNLDLAFKNRQLACEKINELYGLNISVEKVIDDLVVSFTGQEKEEYPDKEE